jgi:predicted glycosyltransferase
MTDSRPRSSRAIGRNAIFDPDVAGLTAPRDDGLPTRFMLYSHDGVGLGHFRRNLVLARALTELDPGASVLLACAADGQETFSLPPGVDVLRLPGVRKLDNGHYVGRRLRLEPGEVRELRASLLASAVEHFRPNVILADKHPLGLDGELLPSLRRQVADGGFCALGLRDVLDDPREAAGEWLDSRLGQAVAEFHQLVLVYGSRELLNPLADGLLPARIASRVRFCGYVVSPESDSAVPSDLPGVGRPFVLATVGGGGDGLPLLETFLRAAGRAPWTGVVVAGPQMESAKWRRLLKLAWRAKVVPFRQVHRVQRWYSHVDALVAMGGYNTLVEAVSSGTPTVCVPRTIPRREQLIRARAFAARGLLWLIEPESLTVGGLTATIQEALAADRPALAERVRTTLDLRGAQLAAGHLMELARTARSDDGEPSADESPARRRAEAAVR